MIDQPEIHYYRCEKCSALAGHPGTLESCALLACDGDVVEVTEREFLWLDAEQRIAVGIATPVE